jgi:hypothetical protein
LKDIIKQVRAAWDEAAESTKALAKQVAEMPPQPTDDESIRIWAERLAADISRFND